MTSVPIWFHRILDKLIVEVHGPCPAEVLFRAVEFKAVEFKGPKLGFLIVVEFRCNGFLN